MNTETQPLESMFRTDMDGYDQAHTIDYIRSIPGLEVTICKAIAIVKEWQAMHPDSIASQTFMLPENHRRADEVYGPAVVDVTLYWDPRTDDPNEAEFGDSPPLGFVLDIPRHPDFFMIYKEEDQYFIDIREPALDQLVADLDALFASRGYDTLINAGLYY